MTLAGVWQGVRQDFNLLEIALIAVAYWAWKRGWRPPLLPSLRLPFAPWVAALGIALGAVALRLAVIPLLPVPIPVVTDEFSHLLLADTLLHGRLTNPTHPFWQHFESLHIIQQPHYVSNYFPGHAAMLALGRVVFASPWAGVLSECAIFLAILYWMLRGWMPPRWSLFGTLLGALRLAIGSYWVNAYHGGFLPAIGGALVAGAFPRLRRDASLTQGLVLGTGLAILALTRPFEGALFSIPFVAMLAWELRLPALVKVAVPATVMVAIAAATIGVYTQQVTGSPLVTAYQISQKTYGWPMALAWTPPPPIQHRHIEMKRYYDYETDEHEKVDGPVNFLEYLTLRLQEYWRFFLGPVLTVPLVMVARVWRRRRMLILGLAGVTAAVLLEGAASPHYYAPATAIVIAIIVECCRYMARSREWRRIIPLLPATMVLVLALRIGAQATGLPYTQQLNFQSWCCKVQGNMNKSRITRMLEQQPGKHVVFVKPKTDPMNLFQWIYNEASIDDSRIAWARDLGPERNAELKAYFGTRQAWLVDPNVEPATCIKY